MKGPTGEPGCAIGCVEAHMREFDPGQCAVTMHGLHHSRLNGDVRVGPEMHGRKRQDFGGTGDFRILGADDTPTAFSP